MSLLILHSPKIITDWRIVFANDGRWSLQKQSRRFFLLLWCHARDFSGCNTYCHSLPLATSLAKFYSRKTALLIFIHIPDSLNSGVLVALLKRLVSVVVGINEIQLKVKDRMLCYGGWLVVRKNMRNVKTCPIEWYSGGWYRTKRVHYATHCVSQWGGTEQPQLFIN